MKTIGSENGITLIETLLVLTLCIIVVASVILPNPFAGFISLFKIPKIQVVEKLPIPEIHEIIADPVPEYLEQEVPISMPEKRIEPEKQEKKLALLDNIYPNNSGWTIKDEMNEVLDEEDPILETKIGRKTKPLLNQKNHTKELFQTYLSIWNEMNQEPEKDETDESENL